MKHDPLYLFENKRTKFDKWRAKRTGSKQDDKDSDDENDREVSSKQVNNPKKTIAPIQPKS